MRYRRLVGAIPLLCCAHRAVADQPINLLSHSEAYDAATQQVTFTLQFDRAPDLWTTDSVGRQHDSFGYWIYGDPTAPYPEKYQDIILGEHIHLYDAITYQDPLGDSGGIPGGWGTLRGMTGFTLVDSTLTFVAPLALVVDSTYTGSNRLFDYRLETFYYGGTSYREDTLAPPPIPEVPEGSSLALFAVGTVPVLVVLRRHRRSRSTQR